MESSMNQRIEDWLSSKAESQKTRSSYLLNMRIFSNFCKSQSSKDPSVIVEEWRATKRLGETQKEIFLEEWQDLIRSFNSWIKPRYAPLTVKNQLATIKSFFRFWNIPIRVDLPRRACVIYHNRDLTRVEVKQILTFASPRDRIMWLVMAESGMRADTAVNLKYWQIKEDFEAPKIPMKIMLPSSSLKDHVGDRWTFIGEDGFKELSEYLKLRMPLKDDDYVFASERQGRVVGDQFTVASLCVKFSRLVQKLGMDKSIGHKPKKIRMHGLRKYFRNNMRTDSSFIKFWMGHSLGVDAHYITRDVERHREEYSKGYEYLRLFEPSLESLADLRSDLREQLRTKDQEIKQLRETQAKLAPFLDFINGFDSPENFQHFMEILKGEFIVKSLEGKGAIHKMEFTPEFNKRLQRVAKLEGKSVSEIVKEGVLKRVSKVERQQKPKKPRDTKT